MWPGARHAARTVRLLRPLTALTLRLCTTTTTRTVTVTVPSSCSSFPSAHPSSSSASSASLALARQLDRARSLSGALQAVRAHGVQRLAVDDAVLSLSHCLALTHTHAQVREVKAQLGPCVVRLAKAVRDERGAWRGWGTHTVSSALWCLARLKSLRKHGLEQDRVFVALAHHFLDTAAQQLQQQQQQQQQQQRGPHELASHACTVLWAFAVGNVRDPAVFSSLYPLLAQRCHTVAPRTAAHALWAVGRLDPRCPTWVLHELANHAACVAHRLSPAELSMACWGVAKLRAPHPRLFGAARHRVRHSLASFEPQGLANVAWALASGRALDLETCTVLAASCSARTVATFKPTELGMLAWALVRCAAEGIEQHTRGRAEGGGEGAGHAVVEGGGEEAEAEAEAEAVGAAEEVGRFLERVADAVVANPGHFAPKHLCTFAWCFGKAAQTGLVPPAGASPSASPTGHLLAATRAIVAHLPPHHAQLSAACSVFDVSNMLWGVAQVWRRCCAGEPAPTAFSTVGSWVEATRPPMTHRDAGIALWAFAAVRASAPPVLDALCERLVRTAHKSDERSLGVAVWALATLGHNHHALVAAVLHLLPSLPPLSPVALGNLAWGLGRLGALSVAQGQAFADRAVALVEARALRLEELVAVVGACAHTGLRDHPLYACAARACTPHTDKAAAVYTPDADQARALAHALAQGAPHSAECQRFAQSRARAEGDGLGCTHTAAAAAGAEGASPTGRGQFRATPA